MTLDHLQQLCKVKHKHIKISSKCLCWPFHCYITTQGILAYYALGRFRRGVNEVTIPTYTDAPPDHNTYPPTYAPSSYNPTTYTPTTYTAYPSNVPDMQQPAFPSNFKPQGDVYQPPDYWDKGSPGLLVIQWLQLHCTDTELYHIDVCFFLFFSLFFFFFTVDSTYFYFYFSCCQIWEPEQCNCKF